jgi:cell division protein FtsW (lipid II flippase)
VSEPAPTPSEAQAALAEASSQAARVRRSDHQLGWMLLGIAAVYLAAGGVISTLPDLRRGRPFAGPAILAILIVGLAALIVVFLRIRAYSRAAILVYFGGIAAFNVWNAIVVGVSIGTRWWASTQPSYHFGVSALVGTIPLLVAARLIWRR